MTLLLALVLSAAVQADGDLRSRVSGLVDQTFRSPDPAKRQEWTDRVTKSIQGVADDSVRAAVVKGLPAAFRYHAGFSLQFNGQGSTVPATPEQLQEGYALQADYLQARVDRISQTPWTPERRGAIETQIDALARGAGRLLKERLQGPVAEKIVDAHFEKLRSAWRSSLDEPFSRFLDTPLTPEQLDSLTADMRAKVADLPVIHLTPEDAKDVKRLQKLGVAQALFDVQEAAFGASALCFKGLAGPENRVLDWTQKLENGLAPALPGAHRFPEPKSLAPPIPRKSPAPQPQPPTVPTAEPPIKAEQDSGRGVPRAAVVLVVALLVALAIGMTLRRRRPA